MTADPTLLQETLAQLGVARVGCEFRAPCPVHQTEETESENFLLAVSPGSIVPLVFRCFKCEYSRKFFAQVADAKGLDKDFLTTRMEEEEIRQLWAAAEVDTFTGLNCPPAAGPDDLHAVYTDLLDRLELTDAHARWLQSRKLDPDWAYSAGYRSSPGDPDAVAAVVGAAGHAALLGVPGFARGPRLLTRRRAILTPCRDQWGRILALKQRLLDGKRGRIRLLSSVTAGGPKALSFTHCPLGVGGRRWPRLWVTEGERKADSFWTTQEQPVVAIPGVGQWNCLLKVLADLVEPAGEVVLAMDRDRAGERCEESLAPVLAKAGYRVLRGGWAGGLKLDEGREFTVREGASLASDRTEARPNPKVSRSEEPGRRLQDHEVIDWLRSRGPTLRDQIPAYSPTLSRLIREGKLQMRKTDRGQLLQAVTTSGE